ncbi:protein ZNF783-like [Thamnophis elegans]|uniref:protein ZNF783-like n=1 Tax=Thamnophis elegans TaxID=35005 RepID=UPI0013786F22|nr:protein ZNF783-like [Thamnophis elegans]
MAGGTPAQVPVVFGDVAICFSAEEWAALAGWQKDLYRDVMAENFQLVSSLECLLAIPELLSQLARGEVPQIDAGPPPVQDGECPVVKPEQEAKAPRSCKGLPSRRRSLAPPFPPHPERSPNGQFRKPEERRPLWAKGR